MHWRWYLLEKNLEQVQIQNLLQEFSQKQIYVNYAFPDGNSSYGNRMNYSFNMFFNTLRNRRLMNCIILFLV